MAKSYMMENDTLLSAEADDSTYPPTRQFFAHFCCHWRKMV